MKMLRHESDLIRKFHPRNKNLFNKIHVALYFPREQLRERLSDEPTNNCTMSKENSVTSILYLLFVELSIWLLSNLGFERN